MLALQIVHLYKEEKLSPDAAIGTLVESGSESSMKLSFMHFVPVKMRFWNATLDGSCDGEGVEATTCDGISVKQVLRQAGATLGIRDLAKVALAQHGTGIVLEDPQLSTEQYGQDFDVVPTSALNRVVVSLRFVDSPKRDEVVLLYNSGKPLLCSAVLSAPGLSILQKPVLIDGDTAVEARPEEKLESSTEPGKMRKLLAFAGDHGALLPVTVSCEYDDKQHSCLFRALRRASACHVREKSLTLLNVPYAQPVLTDTGGCIIDDLCTMADLDSLTFILCD